MINIKKMLLEKRGSVTVESSIIMPYILVITLMMVVVLVFFFQGAMLETMNNKNALIEITSGNHGVKEIESINYSTGEVDVSNPRIEKFLGYKIVKLKYTLSPMGKLNPMKNDIISTNYVIRGTYLLDLYITEKLGDLTDSSDVKQNWEECLESE